MFTLNSEGGPQAVPQVFSNPEKPVGDMLHSQIPGLRLDLNPGPRAILLPDEQMWALSL